MKKSILILLLIAFISGVNAQNKKITTIAIDNEKLMGRWIETERVIDSPSSTKDSLQTPAIFIFKENNMFHKGEDKNGVILFAVAGKYRISNDSVTVHYYDMSAKYAAAAANKLRKMTMQVERLSEKELLVNVSDGNYTKYKALFSKQELGNTPKTRK